MLALNPKALVVAGSVLAVAAIAGLGFNQYQLAKNVSDQASFDIKVMKQDQKIWAELQAHITPTATPAAALKGLRPSVSPKVNISQK